MNAGNGGKKGNGAGEKPAKAEHAKADTAGKHAGEKMEKDRGSTALSTRRGGSLGRTWEPMNRLRAEFDRMLDDFFPGWAGVPARGGDRSRFWDLDVSEQDDRVVVRAEVPGFEAGDFDIQLRGNQLLISAEHKTETSEEGSSSWEQREFYRAVMLPTTVDEGKVEAKYRNGVLCVEMPKSEQNRGRKIQVS